MTIDSVKNMKEALCEKLKVSFGSTVEEASDAQMMRASALVLRDVMAERSVDSMRENRAEHRRQVHYLSMEFLMGRSLMKNAFNLGVGEILTEALNELGFRAADVFECEPDAGLGDGGLDLVAHVGRGEDEAVVAVDRAFYAACPGERLFGAQEHCPD